MIEDDLRNGLARLGEALYSRGYAPGSSGNISVRLPDGVLITPTNSCLGRLDARRIPKVALSGEHLSGDGPSKELFLHLAIYQERPQAQAVVHLHSPHAMALSCMVHPDPANVLPPITPYFVMRIGRLPLIPYFRPGDLSLAMAVREEARNSHAMLLANHGLVVSGKSLQDAVYNAEELEETSRRYLLLEKREIRCLSPEQVAELKAVFST